jgi:hypothetical protein
MELRVAGWETMLEGLQAQDGERFRRGMQLHQEAVTILKEMAAQGN